jgi:hypothetical protein
VLVRVTGSGARDEPNTRYQLGNWTDYAHWSR